MSEPFLAEIRIFAGNFAPRGWALCDGQILPINQNQSLYSLLGTTYGGDGRTTFALPDLRGRLAMHAGNGPGLSDVSLGQKSGAETVTLTVGELPAHNHLVECVSSVGDQTQPAGHIPAAEAVDKDLWSSNTANETMKASMIKNTGGGQSHTNMQPYQAVNYIIALTGLFPSRN